MIDLTIVQLIKKYKKRLKKANKDAAYSTLSLARHGIAQARVDSYIEILKDLKKLK